MTPKIIRTEAEYRDALEHVRHLRGGGQVPEGHSDLELWTLLIERYEATRSAAAVPGLLDAVWSRVRNLRPAQEGPRPPRVPPLATGTWVFFGAAALAVYLRLMYRASFFPPFFEGEEGKVLDLAKATCEFAAYTHSWWQTFIGDFIEYNKGYSWALVPFYPAFGYDVRLITTILPVFFSIFCAAFFTIYRKTYPKSSLLSFVLVVVFSVLCLSLRRYKWHSLTYLTAISIYLYFLPHFYGGAFFLRDRWRKVLSLLLFGISCYFYFGCLVYAVPFVILIVIFSDRRQRRRDYALACAGLAAFAVAFVTAYKITDVWRWRLIEEWAYVKEDFSRDGLMDRWHATRDFFFTLDLSGPYLVLFVVGLGASLYRIRRGDRFALVNTTLLLCLWLFQMTIQGLNNPDQLNWSMIPLLGVLLIGADEILVPLRNSFRGGAIVAAALVSLVGWHEIRHYLPLNRDTPYQPFVQERCTRTQAALILMTIRDDDSGSVQYYLPDPSVPEADGGFDYSVSLLRADFAEAFSRVIYFKNEQDLRRRLSVQRKDKWAVVYLSVAEKPEAKDSVDPADVPLLGQKPVIIHPFEDVYGIPFLVRSFRLLPGPTVPAAGGART